MQYLTYFAIVVVREEVPLLWLWILWRIGSNLSEHLFPTIAALAYIPSVTSMIPPSYLIAKILIRQSIFRIGVRHVWHSLFLLDCKRFFLSDFHSILHSYWAISSLNRKNYRLEWKSFESHYVYQLLEIKTFNWSYCIVFITILNFVAHFSRRKQSEKHCLSTKNSCII